jgi:hypothetical protein
MGSPPPGGTGQSRKVDIESPIGDRDEFQNNFRTYVAFMKAFRNAWESIAGNGIKHVKETPSVLNGGFPVSLDIDAADVEFAARVAVLEDGVRELLLAASQNNWIGKPPA